MNNLKGKVMVVTGASAGLGRAILRKLAGQGANIALIARGEDGFEGRKKGSRGNGRKSSHRDYRRRR